MAFKRFEHFRSLMKGVISVIKTLSQNYHEGAEIYIFWPEKQKKIFLYPNLDN